jgi:RNA polymerase sigma factor (sigma-70 family)
MAPEVSPLQSFKPVPPTQDDGVQPPGVPPERAPPPDTSPATPITLGTTCAATGRGHFPTTQWSMILKASDRGPGAPPALEGLCRAYWYPLYSYVRRRGHDHATAEDLTQEFFRQLLASDRLSRATPERGRFRGYLVANLRHFLAHDWEKLQAQKRGGNAKLLPLDAERAEERFQGELADAGLTPEQAFDRAWALQVIERALHEVGAEFAATGRARLFAQLQNFVWGNAAGASYDSVGAELGMTAGAVKVAIHRLRQKVREQLRVEVGATLADPAQTESELNHLLAALQAKPAPGA